MFLKSLTIENYRSYRDPSELDCSAAITVVAGRNNAGKSNIITSLLLLSEAARTAPIPTLNEAQWQRATFARKGGTLTITAGLHAELARELVQSEFPVRNLSASLVATMEGLREGPQPSYRLAARTAITTTSRSARFAAKTLLALFF